MRKKAAAIKMKNRFIRDDISRTGVLSTEAGSGSREYIVWRTAE